MKNYIPVIYKDLLFRGIACLLAAHYIVMMGRPQLSTFQALMIPSYYPTLLVNYAIALIVGMGVKRVTILLDRQHDWYRDIWRRAMLQFICGVIGVSILSFFLVWLYFFAFGQDLIDSGYLNYELPFSISLITILNFYYVAYYFYMYPRSLDRVPSIDSDRTQMNPIPLIHQQESNLNHLVPEYIENIKIKDLQMNTSYSASPMIKETEEKKETKEILIVDTAVRSIPIRLRDVAMFLIYDKTVFVGMMGCRSFNECYQLSLSLTEIMDLVDESQFFRINRQCIVNFDLIAAFEIYGEKGLKLVLKNEDFGLDDIDAAIYSKVCTVSGDKVATFKDWMNR
ncbi:membrane hypothetical protein [Sphingobacterium sp. PM2-P1-29]|nr:membrane hypothetical protein [Sphingobacterium sp. PM2-P1-29]